MPSPWPKDNYAAKVAFYGPPGDDQLTKVVPPFKMYYGGKPLSHLAFHKKAAPALERVFRRIWEYYDKDQATIDKLDISKTAGTYNLRKISGSNNWSNHAWAIAIDIDAEDNGFNMIGDIPPPVVAAFKSEGFRWGGNYKGRTDPMHFEAVDSGEPTRTFDEWLEYYGVPKHGDDDVPTPPDPKLKNTWPTIVEKVLESEGGFTNHPADDGGPTNFGITIADYRQFVDSDGTVQELKDMDVSVAKKIYKEKYWDKVKGDELPAGLDYALFDFALHSGWSKAAKFLQKILGVTQDGYVGAATLAAIRARNNPIYLINALMSDRMGYLRQHHDWGTFGKGWTNRWNRVSADSLKMAEDALKQAIDDDADEPAAPEPTPAPTPTPDPRPTLWDRLVRWLGF